MKNITVWDKIAATYDEHSYQGKDGAYPANRYRADRVIEYLRDRPVGKILDAGGGTGYVAKLVTELGWDVTYYDASAAMLQVAKRKTNGQLAAYYQGSVTDMSRLADRTFDAVMMNGVLPYLNRREESAAYRETYRILKPNGQFIAANYNQFFDLLALNYFTATTLANLTERPNVRIVAQRLKRLIPSIKAASRTMLVENPLTYPVKLRKHGFEEHRRHYYNFHVLPPDLETPADNRARAKLESAYHDSWQGLFLAKAFLVMAQKV